MKKNISSILDDETENTKLIELFFKKANLEEEFIIDNNEFASIEKNISLRYFRSSFVLALWAHFENAIDELMELSSYLSANGRAYPSFKNKLKGSPIEKLVLFF